jgi:outer membrane protein OmpA-like peptidoglycan-associated protein
LLIGTTSDFPWAFTNFEYYDYLRFALLEPKDRQAILDDPVGKFSDMMAAEGHHHAYLLLSPSQVADVEMLGALPRGALARITQTLIDSPKFTVIYRNSSAMVMTPTQPAPQDGGSQPASSGPGAGVSQPPTPSPGTGSPAASSGPGAGVSQPSPNRGDGGACANLQADVTGLLSTPINFDTDGFTLTEGSQQVLNPVADKLKSCSDSNVAVSVTVSAYTDNTGNDAINIPLSASRAKSVADYLVSRGVVGDFVTSTGLGSAIRSRTTTPPMGEPIIAASRSASDKENSTWTPLRSPRRSWEGTA